MKHIAITLLFLSSTAFASTVSTSKITKILAGKSFGNLVFVQISNLPTTDKATCNSNNLWTYVFDSSTDVGKTTLSLAMTAYVADKDISIGGTGECGLFSDVESLGHIQLN